MQNLLKTIPIESSEQRYKIEYAIIEKVRNLYS